MAVRFIILAVLAFFITPDAYAGAKTCTTDIDTLQRLCKTEVYQEDRLCRAEQKAYCVWKYSLCIRRCGAQDSAQDALRLKQRTQQLEEKLQDIAAKTLQKRRQCEDANDCVITYYRNGCSALAYSALRPKAANRIEKDLPVLKDYIARSGNPAIACRRAEVIPQCNSENTCVFGGL